MQAEFDMHDVTNYAAQRALVDCNNNYNEARVYLQANLDKLKKEEAILDVDTTTTDLDAGTGANEDVSRGLYCDPMGSVQVNVQTCEVYLRDRMLMPVPPDISGHPDFKLVFGNDSNSLFCAVREVCRYSRTINIMHDERVYEVKAWKPFCAESVAMSLDDDDVTSNDEEDNAGVMLLGGLPDQPCYNMPTRVEGNAKSLFFNGRTYVPYTAGACGWVSRLFDNLLTDSLRNAHVDQKPHVWVENDALRSFEGKSEPSKSSNAGSLSATMLFYLGPEGDLEETKGHPGAFFEVWALQHRKIVLVFSLQEIGRRVQRQLIYSSDTRFALRSLPQESGERFAPWLPNCRFAGGNMFEGLLSSEGKLIARAGAGKHMDDSAGSLVITRTRIQVKQKTSKFGICTGV